MNWIDVLAIAKKYVATKIAGLGTASTKNYTDYLTADSTDLPESRCVFQAIASAVSSVYEPAGDITCAELTEDLLVQANVGNIYNVSDSGTTTDLFTCGAGTAISANDNVLIVKSGEDFKYQLLGNLLDLRDYQKKILSSAITIDGTQYTTVETALNALAEVFNSNYYTKAEIDALLENKLSIQGE